MMPASRRGSSMSRVRAASGREPVIHRFGNGVCRCSGSHAVFVVALNLSELVFSLSLCLTAGFARDAFAAAVVADGHGGYPALAAFVPVKAAVSFAAPDPQRQEVPSPVGLGILAVAETPVAGWSAAGVPSRG